MKKTYINPTTTIVNIKLQQMVATSTPQTQTLDNNEQPITNGNDIGARKFSNLWDDENY